MSKSQALQIPIKKIKNKIDLERKIIFSSYSLLTKKKIPTALRIVKLPIRIPNSGTNGTLTIAKSQLFPRASS